MSTWELWFDRTASPALLAALSVDGALHGLVERRTEHPLLLDVQFRKESKGATRSASLYAGLSRIVRVLESRGRFRIDSDATYRRIGGFDSTWDSWMDPDVLADAWPAVEEFINAVLADESVLPRLTDREGVVHGALASGAEGSVRLIQREAAPSFRDQATKDQILSALEGPIHAAMTNAGRNDRWWPGVRDGGRLPSLGSKVDFVGVDEPGRLLVIEAKPSDELKGVTWAPAQVLLYASLFRRLVGGPNAVSLLSAMLDDRVACGLSRAGAPLAESPVVVPVVAIGAGPMSTVVLDRLAAVHEALASVWTSSGVAPLEVWFLDSHGVIEDRWLPHAAGAPSLVDGPTAGAPASGFVRAARESATTWKATSPVLSVGARPPAPYRGRGAALPFCLPLDHAVENLLPDARALSLERFAAAGIPWHHGIGAGPSNHLLSSQVQCANALAPLVDRPDEVKRLFAPVLPIDEVLPFGATSGSPFDGTDHVVFEWNGEKDYLGERGGGPGTRGANSTSVDAAIRYRSESGAVEIALIEWKYVEQYRGHRLSGGDASMQVRHERYRHFFDDPDSPIRTDLVSYAALFAEPLYQLMRQQLLAWQMEAAGELGAARVRLVVVAPSLNHDLAASYDPSLAAMVGAPEGSSVHAVWRAMLRRPDRFRVLDSAALVSADAPTSAEFRARYVHLAGGAQQLVQTPTGDEIRSAAVRTAMVLKRISGEGGVLEQLIDVDDALLDALDPWLRRRIHDRLRALGEDARSLRAHEIHLALSSDD